MVIWSVSFLRRFIAGIYCFKQYSYSLLYVVFRFSFIPFDAVTGSRHNHLFELFELLVVTCRRILLSQWQHLEHLEHLEHCQIGMQKLIASERTNDDWASLFGLLSGASPGLRWWHPWWWWDLSFILAEGCFWVTWRGLRYKWWFHKCIWKQSLQIALQQNKKKTKRMEEAVSQTVSLSPHSPHTITFYHVSINKSNIFCFTYDWIYSGKTEFIQTPHSFRIFPFIWAMDLSIFSYRLYIYVCNLYLTFI